MVVAGLDGSAVRGGRGGGGGGSVDGDEVARAAGREYAAFECGAGGCGRDDPYATRQDSSASIPQHLDTTTVYPVRGGRRWNSMVISPCANGFAKHLI